MTDFRALCEELVDALKDENTYTIRIELIDRACAALAEDPVGPTDEEIMEMMPQEMRDDLAAAARALAEVAGTDSRRAMGIMRIILNRHAVDHAHAVIARWGHPPEPEPVDQTDDSDLLQFLLDNFRARSLHMDGTAYYVLDTGWPFNHRSSNSRAFVEQAYHKSCEHFRKQS